MGTAAMIICFVAGGFAIPAAILSGQEAFTSEPITATARAANGALVLICLGVFVFSMFQVISRLSALT